MQIEARISLKKDKDRPIRQRHHWIYSKAVEKVTEFEEGALAEVVSAEGEKLGLALLSKGAFIVGQMIAFGSEGWEETLKRRIDQAIAFRRSWFDPNVTNAYRLINAEGDGIPGLIVDSYNGVLVLQASTPGIERLKLWLIEQLAARAQPKAIFEKSTSSLRKKEGMARAVSLLYGASDPIVEVLENRLCYSVHLLEGQKTGLFLDQREMRSLIGSLSSGKKVLNCFCYSGGFSIAALAGGAAHVDSVDISAKCAPVIEKNLSLNHLRAEKHCFFARDAIDFVVEHPFDYDLVILDPPAFAKKRQDIPRASHAYRKLNRTALEKMKPGSILLTCSCSSQIDEETFQTILFKAALESGREVKIIGRHRQAADHPISIYHPETSYLKSLVLEVCL